MVSVPKYLKDAEDTAPHVAVSYPPGHKSIFNPIVTLSPLVEYECKSANVGVTPRVTFFEVVTKLFLNLKGYGLVLDQGFTPSLVLN